MAVKNINVKLVKSRFVPNPKQRGTLKALGLWRIGQSTEHQDNSVIRGMIFKVKHLVEIL
ncbi:MAG: 50S ribosomal protein L30 [Spirochaetes bacterium GWF1_31_7]|nr:MAG: 50S ribosomal protein L30 [Spirochaetes bacterium GWE1_32_154]OHD47304.1 MAG: 50S ribosomal protein L30 [Spirochaetes bacterium GWE2_31_10]OHD47363.1 MAG: 50S ribosomal protein L30 [Spirochaetes bacterium GWF1_31_7]OHD81753.1 MAG: 50S ribosomal protein L30 [Spirochaetes bacterium RIFOXYB1_FULL_32_8]HBD92816.1 50S ribosomal protein L30 [Spirochaetia bacterium]